MSNWKETREKGYRLMIDGYFKFVNEAKNYSEAKRYLLEIIRIAFEAGFIEDAKKAFSLLELFYIFEDESYGMV